MPKFTYVGDDDRYYSTLPEGSRQPVKGQSYDLDSDPGDGRWTTEAPIAPRPIVTVTPAE